MKVHLIAIGGSIMHNLALALKEKGYTVTGSDDHIYEPAYSRLEKHGLLPETMGWNPEKITKKLDFVILGMHAKPDNPELKKALELRLKVMSFPEFIYNQSKRKKRVVIAGSHGKTSVTGMIMHALKKNNYEFDYAVGSNIPGFENSVKLSDAPIIIIEGDEYLSSPIDPQPKFMWYQPQVALINGIAWDHINVFPTYEIYKEQFVNFIKSMKTSNELFYNAEDREVEELVLKYASHLMVQPVHLPGYKIINGKTIVTIDNYDFPITIFGKHNLINLSGAQKICEALRLNSKDFWTAMADYTGAGKRLEKIDNDKNIIAFRDFAHAPSKVRATVNAVKEQFPNQNLVAVLELHTFSSLNKDFIVQYADSLSDAGVAVVYVDNEALASKGGDTYSEQQIREAFNRQDLLLIESKESLEQALKPHIDSKNTLLFMSSGNFGGLNILSLIIVASSLN
jgi:UDP-N-acetylmuramate: L-alanyl-gamma-D-glutamyl-meso-diaminopimelate ligase